MKFTAIVITKKKILISALIISAAAFTTAVGMYIRSSNSVLETFNAEEIYESVLSEGLSSDDENGVNIKELVNKLIGFNMDEPETIAEHEIPMITSAPLNSDENIAQATVEPTPTQQPPMPTETPKQEALIDYDAIHSASGLAINNATSYSVDVDSACAEEMPFKIDSDGPQVLVVHTHTTECYNGDAMSGETERTTDDTRNVIAVGKVICGILEEYGIKTVHDTTVHDYPSYQSAYTRTLKTIDENLKKYPSIKVVLDVHRDAFIYEDGSKLKVTCDQNGISTAKVMLVVGTDSMGLSHPNWRGNLNFAAKIQNAAEKMYPGLMRPIDLRRERFNMHMTRGSLLLEVGSNGNSLAEALEGGADVAKAIAAVLLNG